MAVPDIKPYWIFVAGMVMLLVVVLFAVADSGPWFGPGGRRRHWPRRTWLGPGGTRHLLGAYNAEGFYDAGATFTMFGVDWCPHCVSTKPEFEKLGATKTIDGKSVTMRYVNPEKDKQAAAGYDIQGYPSLFLEKGGQKMKYSGQRTAQAFEEWLSQNL
jgi:thiol-disulfide isomerase/thioredoxin